MLTPEQAKQLASDLLLDDSEDQSGGELSGYDHAHGRATPGQIKNYMLLEQIGSGGMGAVFRVWDQKLKRIVALKLLQQNLASRSALRRFQYEAEILAEFNHQGIARVYETGSHDDGTGGVPYIVMEYIPHALPITRYADRHELDIRQRLEMFAEVCDAVYYAHLKGVIHRDLKPDNILVGSEETERRAGAKVAPDSLAVAPNLPGEAADRVSHPHSAAHIKIIDFGIARATNADLTRITQITDAGALIGTLNYMSPEQCDGHVGDLDMRSDVYSLGVVMYELICGRLPYDLSASSVASAARTIQECEPKSPLMLAKGSAAGCGELHSIPRKRDVATIVLKALEKDRSKRYQSAADLRDDIRRYLKGEPIAARKPTAWAKTMRWVARHPKTATAIACITFCLSSIGAGIGIAWWLNTAPGPLVVANDKSFAELRSHGGRVLARFGTGTYETVHFVARQTLPQQMGGHETIIRVIPSGEHSTASQLWITKLDDLDCPLFKTRDGPPFIEMPEPKLRGTPDSGVSGGQASVFADYYRVRNVIIAQVFDDSLNPGPEMIVIHQSDYSPSAIRVYSMDMKVLYEVWHDGPLRKMAWLEGLGVLIFSGDMHGFKLEDKDRKTRYAQIVGALRPQFGRKAGYIYRRDRETIQEVEWYRGFAPVDQVATLDVEFIAEPRSDLIGKTVPIVLTIPKLGAVTVRVEADGKLRNERGLSDYIRLTPQERDDLQQLRRDISLLPFDELRRELARLVEEQASKTLPGRD